MVDEKREVRGESDAATNLTNSDAKITDISSRQGYNTRMRSRKTVLTPLGDLLHFVISSDSFNALCKIGLKILVRCAERLCISRGEVD